MIDYRAPVPEMLFALRHGAEAARLPGWDDELASEVVTQAARLVDGMVAPIDPVGDIHPAKLVDGRVVLPPGYGDAYRAYRDGGWPGLAMPEAYGGQELPHALAAVVSEMLSGACMAFQMILSLAWGASRTIAAHGTDAQKDYYLPRLASGEWLATMCLTEAQAGSDLGLVRTMAAHRADGSYRLTGGKVFISNGDQDLTSNIVHLVLARTPDAPSGVKGLSLFLCPAVRPDGTRNGVTVLRLEEKMGLHGSPTCQLAFDDAEAGMVGNPGEGLARMFTMMNAERMDVAVQGVGLADVARQRSWAYAGERRQGRSPGARATDLIARHADVRRMLLTQAALARGCRAMVLRIVVELELGQRPALVEFMTPVCKAFVTDAMIECAQLAVQIHGGYGFLREYRVEQIARDGRIAAIYEGTNGIQAMTLAGRLARMDNGACLDAFRTDIGQAAQAAGPAAAAALGRALADWERATAALLARTDAGLVATSYLRLTGLVALAAAWSRLEQAADHAPDPERTRALAAFVRDWMLPETAHLANRVGCGAEIAHLPEEMFAS